MNVLSCGDNVELKYHKVLIVEDEVLIALDLVDIVSSAGALPVGPAGSVRQALRYLESTDVTAAILDVNLGNEDSLEIACWLRAAGIPFIYHSGHFSEKDPPRSWPVAPLARKPAASNTLVATLVAATKAHLRPLIENSN